MTQTHSKFEQLLAEQIRHELTASQQYLAIAVWYDDQDLPQLAARYYGHSLEERGHALKIVQYFLDRDVKVLIPGIDEVKNDFEAFIEPIKLTLDQERTVTGQIKALFEAARAENDALGEQFILWFLKEQVEEEASVSTLLTVAERANGNVFDLEAYIARELAATGEGADPTAPATAGGAA